MGFKARDNEPPKAQMEWDGEKEDKKTTPKD